MARNSKNESKLLAILENAPANLLLLGIAGLIALGTKALYNTHSSLNKIPTQLQYTMHALNKGINPPVIKPETMENYIAYTSR